MDNNFEIETIPENAEEVKEEAVETQETETEAVEAETADVEAEAVEVTETAARPKKKVLAAVAVIAAVVIVAAAMITSKIEFNKYNKLGYVNISGKTIQDLIDSQDMELSEFLEMYGLPEDMPADTTESAAYYSIPVGKIAEMYGMDFDTLKTTLNIPGEITEDVAWGIAEGEIALADYVGADNVESFKTQYGLDASVTGETKWKELRNTVDTKQKEAREAQEAASETTKDSADTDSDADTGADDTTAETETE